MAVGAAVTCDTGWSWRQWQPGQHTVQWPGCGIDDLGFYSWQVKGIFLLSITPRPSLGPPKSHHMQWVLWIRRQGHEEDCSPPTKAEIQNEWTCTSTPLIHLHGMQRHNSAIIWTDSSKYVHHIKNPHCTCITATNCLSHGPSLVFITYFIPLKT